jgi:hypothetical protein
MVDMTTQLTHSLILQLIFQYQVVDRLFISLEKVQWIVMPVLAVVSLLGDLNLVLPLCPQALAQMMCQLMMQLNFVSTLIVRTWHFWNAKIVAHFLSLALIAPCSLILYGLTLNQTANAEYVHFWV